IYQEASLHLIWQQTGWQVTLFPPDASTNNPACLQIGQDITSIIGDFAVNNQQVFVQGIAQTPGNPTNGCLALLRPDPNVINNTVTPISQGNEHLAAYCLERFGVVLAANDVAHRFWPYLPVANA